MNIIGATRWRSEGWAGAGLEMLPPTHTLFVAARSLPPLCTLRRTAPLMLACTCTHLCASSRVYVPGEFAGAVGSSYSLWFFRLPARPAVRVLGFLQGRGTRVPQTHGRQYHIYDYKT